MKEQDNYAPAIVFAIILIMIVTKMVAPGFRFSDLITALATLVAAFVGAKAAFSLQIRKHQEDEIKKQRVAVNQTLHLIAAEMWQNLYEYNSQAISYALKVPAPWLCMKFRVPSSSLSVKLPHEDLLFLLETKYANLYAELLHIQKTYYVTFEWIELLYKTTLEELQPKMEELGYVRSSNIDVTKLEVQLGPILVSKLKGLTKDVLTEVPDTMRKLQELYYNFRTAMVEHFECPSIPEIKFKDFEN